MIYTRQDHFQFLEEELRAVTEAFKKKLETQAVSLMQDKGEMFVAQFITFPLVLKNLPQFLELPNSAIGTSLLNVS